MKNNIRGLMVDSHKIGHSLKSSFIIGRMINMIDLMIFPKLPLSREYEKVWGK
jgi:hypothetical protein